MTQLEAARKNKITEQMKRIAKEERISVSSLAKAISNGTAVIPSNKLRRIKNLCAIGKGLKTKVNANIGTSLDAPNLDYELKKLKVLIKLGADAVMDLSTGGDLDLNRKRILENSPVPVGTVPIYQAAIEAIRKYGTCAAMSQEQIFSCIEKNAEDGVDFVTLHCGVTNESLYYLKKYRRVINVVSRGGAFLIEWMKKNKKENPLYENFDRILDIAKRYDVTLSLGDGLRPGAIADGTDRAQIQELKILGRLAKRAKAHNVQVIIEGPGHIALNQIEKNIKLQKKITDGAPFYVLGPIVTDVAPGYDHITSAIGGSLAAYYGADFLCYVTPSEHLRLPSIEDVKEGLIAAKIAAHAADIAKGLKGAGNWDRQMSMARKKRDWTSQINLAIEKSKPALYRRQSRPKIKDACTMCGEYCSMRLTEKI